MQIHKCSIHDEEYPEGLECRGCAAGLPPKVEHPGVDVWKVECNHCHRFTTVPQDGAAEALGFDGLLTAAIQTLRDNRHLADGDECTLKELRDAVAEIKPDWEA